MKDFRSTNNKGFTLIELLVVILILGLLAGIVGPKLFGQSDDAKVKAARIQMKQLSTALKMYKLDNGVFPSTEQGLEALVKEPTGGDAPKRWRKGGYLENGILPKDPWHNPFVYLYPGTNGDFDLSSYGMDGVPGGDGYNKDINSWEVEE